MEIRVEMDEKWMTMEQMIVSTGKLQILAKFENLQLQLINTSKVVDT